MWGGPWGDRWVMRHSRRVSGWDNDRSDQMRAKSGNLGGIFGRFGALRGALGVTDG